MFTMRKTIFAVAIVAGALALGGCARLTAAYDILSGVRVTQSHIDFAHATYTAGFLSWAAEYRDLYRTNPCAPGERATVQNICAERSVVVTLQETDKIVAAAFDTIEADYAECTLSGIDEACTGLPAAYKTLTTAIGAAKALAVQYGGRP